MFGDVGGLQGALVAIFSTLSTLFSGKKRDYQTVTKHLKTFRGKKY
jgi:hypothetical protein